MLTARARRLLRWIASAAAILLAVALARTMDWGAIGAALRRASLPLVAAAALANLLSLLVRGARWRVFLAGAGAPSLGLALRGAVVGSGFNNLIPANGGEAVRVLLVARGSGVSSATVLATLALDRLVELLSCAALLVAAPFVVPLPAALARWRVPLALAVAALLVLLALLARHAARPASAAAPHPGALRAYVARFLAGVTGLPTARRLAPALALSLVSWAGQAAVYHLAALAVGLPVSPAASVAAMLTVNLAFLVQVTPGNVGVVQLLYALVMTAYGLPRGPAIGAAVLLQAIQIVPVTALALALAPSRGRRRFA